MINNKEAIKEIIDSGGTIRFPYKTNLKDWYSEISIFRFDDRYHVTPGTNFYSWDGAISYYFGMILAPKNAAYVIERLKRRGIVCDLEDPDESYLTEFKKEKKKVSEDFKKLDIIHQKVGTRDEMEDALKKIIEGVQENQFPSSLYSDLRTFLDVYSLNLPHVSVSFCYSINTQDSIFRHGEELKCLTPDTLRKAKDLSIFQNPDDVKYLHTELSISYQPKEGGGKIYKRYELKI